MICVHPAEKHDGGRLVMGVWPVPRVRYGGSGGMIHSEQCAVSSELAVCKLCGCSL